MRSAHLILLLLVKCYCYAFDFSVGSTVTPGRPWKSAGGTFGFGFTRAGRDFNLAIWYERDPNKSAVWTAVVDGQMLQVSGNAKVQFKAEGGLLVIDRGRSSKPLWQTNPEQCCSRGASLLENGNLVVYGTDGHVVWQSFDSPTTTLLPEQQLHTPGKAGFATLISMSGAYQLLLTSGQLLLKNLRQEIPQKYWSITSPYLNSTMTCLDDETGEQVLDNVGCQPDASLVLPAVLNLSSQGLVSFYDGTGKSWKSEESTSQYYTLDYNQADVLRRLTLDNDGNLRIYSLSSSGMWIVTWQAVHLECDIFGACGAFGLCTHRPRKTCSCPPGFHRVDPSDESKGCDYNVPLGACQSSPSTGMKLVQVYRADYFFNDYSFNAAIKSLQQCKDTCLQDCKCLAVAYRYDGSGMCYLKGGSEKLYNGKQRIVDLNFFFMKISSLDISTDDQLLDFFISNMNGSLNDQIMPKPNKRTVYLWRHLQSIVVAVAVAEFGLFITGAMVVACIWRRNYRKKWEEITAEMEGLPVRFTYKQLRNATENFSDELGSGGFGSVYKGNIRAGAVAVKVITGEKQAEKQFKAEVATIGRYQHVSLVRLLGYCAEGKHRLLVYEFMPNSSLDRHLFNRCSVKGFSSWETRFGIAVGVAKGITYLHEKCGECIVHCDIKPQNVLLDENLNAKVADFGLARLLRKDSMCITTVKGTRGYLAPEWVEDSSITPKADVYSYGMLLLDLVGGQKKNTSLAVGDDQENYFPAYVFHRCTPSEMKTIADPELVMVDWKQFEVVVKIALWCVQLDPGSRPVMSRVLRMLEGIEEVPPPPFPDVAQINIC